MSIRHYHMEIEAIGPVHIGNGSQYGKRDYFAKGNSILVLDTRKFVSLLNAQQISRYCDFLEDNRGNLQLFLQKNPDMQKLATKALAYKVDSPLATARRGAIQYHDVWEFVKDPYGKPYVPGSSVKGMLRTAILLGMLLDDAGYRQLYDNRIERDAKADRKADASIMKRAFFKERPSKTDSSIANDIMKYISVSDSEPLSTTDLVFAKKYDRFSKNDPADHKPAIGKLAQFEGNDLDIYRECLRPGTKIPIDAAIDERIEDYLGGIILDAQGINAVLQRSFDFYTKCFLRHFEQEGAEERESSASDDICGYVIPSGPLAGLRCRNHAIENTGYCRTHQEQAAKQTLSRGVICYLGGGIGFMNKTVVGALFGSENERLRAISRILYNQFPSKVDRAKHLPLWAEIQSAGFQPKAFRAKPKSNGRPAQAKNDHRHWRDEQLGVSPHTMKYGAIGKKKYQMGKCIVRIQEA